MRDWLLALLGVGLVTLACQIPDMGGAEAAAASLTGDSQGDSVQSPQVRRVWARARSYASPSPDGRYVTYVDWSTGDVAMRDLRTGESRRLTDKGPWTEDGSWAEYPLFSPDGERVVYAYGNTDVAGAGHRYELRMVELGDPTQHVVHPVSIGEFIGPMDWSAAQGILVEVNRESGGSELALVDPDDGSLRTLETFPEGAPHPHGGAVSPDGRRIVYRRDDRIYLRNQDTGRNRVLDLRVGSLLGWTPEGDAVLVHTKREGSVGIWALPLTEDGLTGQPQLVRGGVPALFPGGFGGGEYFYRIPVDAPKIYRATVDLEAGRILSPPRAVTSPVDGTAEQAVWSSDGGSLAYVLKASARPWSRIMVKMTNGDRVREVARTELEPRNLRWSADGEALFFLAGNPTRAVPDLYRLDLRTGGISRAVEGAGSAVALAPDGRTGIFLRRPVPPGSEDSELVVRDLKNGTERLLKTFPRELGPPRSLALSPEGGRVGFVRGDRTDATVLSILRLETGEVRDIYSVDRPRHLEKRHGDLTWTPDGRQLLVTRGVWEQDGSHELLAVPVNGGEPTVVADWDGRRWAALHPDGRRLAFTGGELREELWVLEDVTEAVEMALSDTH